MRSRSKAVWFASAPSTLSLFVLFAILHAHVYAVPAADEARIAVVQLEVNDAMCSNVETFESRIRSIFEATSLRGAELVVFPEYTSALLGLALLFGPEVERSSTFAEFLLRAAGRTRMIDAGVPERPGALRQVFEIWPPGASAASAFSAMSPEEPANRHENGIRSVAAGGNSKSGKPDFELLALRRLAARLLRDGADETLERMDALWGGLAVEYETYIGAGTYFARGEAGRLHNRAVVYDPAGRRVYEQDKVYLTRFETDLLGVSPGRVRAAGTFPAASVEAVLTICRDTFFDEWESVFSGADVWFDLKANGTDFDEEEMQRFERALPARIASSGIAFGATVCLTGRVLDLYWEGESSLVGPAESGGYLTYARAPDHDREAIIFFDPIESR